MGRTTGQDKRQMEMPFKYNWYNEEGLLDG
jgi:hypothetical protein